MSDELYTYKVGRRQVRLRKINTSRFVSPQNGESTLILGARLSRSSRLGIHASVQEGYLVVNGDPAKMDEVNEYPDVKCTRSSFVDDHGYHVILTDDVLIRFKEGVDYDARRALCEKLNCFVLSDDEDTWIARVSGLDEDEPLNVVHKLEQEKQIAFAEPNALQEARFLEPESFFPNQWHLQNTGQQSGRARADVRAIQAWQTTKGSPQVRVVVHDSGIDLSHPDISNNLVPGVDFDNPGGNPGNVTNFHGTACAGIIAATEDGHGIVGVAPQCKLVPLKLTRLATPAYRAQTLIWAAKSGEIISCSWATVPSNEVAQAIHAIVNKARGGKGIPCFFATGNEGRRGVLFPAFLPDAIGVGASTNLDVLSTESNFGRGLDFLAPSSGGTLKIETTDLRGGLGRNPAGDYCKAADETGFGRTSAANALAAGIGALVLSANPNLTAAQVRFILRDTCDKIAPTQAGYDANGWSETYGFGRLNAFSAVKAASMPL